MFKKYQEATDLDKLLHAELDQFEKEAEQSEQEEEAKTTLSAGVISQTELVQALTVCKNSVETVFGEIVFYDKSGEEKIRNSSLQILLAVLQQVCPRQVNYNVMENLDTGTGEEW